jgi:hypothetical protein
MSYHEKRTRNCHTDAVSRGFGDRRIGARDAEMSRSALATELRKSVD